MRRAHAIGLGLAAVYVALLIATAPAIGMSRDESFYAHAARDYGTWFAQLALAPRAALERPSIDRAWDYNWEHPALMKSASALSSQLQRRTQLFAEESTAFRLPGMLCAGALLWLICVWGTRVHSVFAGVVAAVLFALMPRVFYHSHLNAFDVPIAFFFVLTAFCYWRSLFQRRWAIAAGVAFGLALATKHNSWMLPGIFFIHTCYVIWARRPGAEPLRANFWWLLAMLSIGPFLLVFTWPWLWFDTGDRLAAYVLFHLRHVHYTYAYLGESYFAPPFPISVPFVMTLFTVPLTTLLLSLWGLSSKARDWFQRSKGIGPNAAVSVLWLGCALAPLLAIALPGSPIFGGTKHWITAYPFVALFAGLGSAHALKALKAHLPAPAVAASLALLIAPAAVETAHSHPFGLSHYTPVAGGVPGAADLGMNRQFWGFTTRSLIPWIKERLPNGGTIWLGDTTVIAWRQMQKDGIAPKNVRVSYSLDSADLVLVHHEDHFAEVDHQAWVAFGSVQPAKVLTYDGVPIVSAYARPATPSPGSPAR